MQDLEEETRRLGELRRNKEALEDKLDGPEKGIRPQIKTLTLPVEKARKAMREIVEELSN